jgi:molecular chaperone GrpE
LWRCREIYLRNPLPSHMENENITPEGQLEETVLSETDTLTAEVDYLKAEVDAGKNKFLRLYAEFENYKKRMSGELDSANRNGKFDTIRSLLGTLDDLERAISFAAAKPEEIIPGVKTVMENFNKNLGGMGVMQVLAEGTDFDPYNHEAIGAVEGEEGRVMHVYQHGYRLGEHLIRPARVLVGNGTSAQATEAQAVTEGSTEDSTDDSTEGSTESGQA